MNPYLATLFTFLIALAFLRLMDFLAHRGIIESKLSRKIIHIGTGPIFVLCWLAALVRIKTDSPFSSKELTTLQWQL